MENYSYTSYPESGDSSPRSREIDFDNTASWEDPNQIPNYKVKFMCSYGGKIHPRPHDNQLAYIGGETKILSVDRNTKFPQIISKLAAICDSDTVSFKYQLPGEDLDALISVTNDDDLEHMMHEYDRLYRASPKPARLRLFLFPANPPSSVGSGVPQSRSFGSEDSKSEKERFVDALNSGPIHASPAGAVASPAGSADFLFGSEKGMVPPHVKLRDPIVEQVVKEPEIPVHVVDDRMIGTDPIQKHIQDLQRLHLEEQQNMYRRKSDDNLASAFAGGHDYYVQKAPEKIAPAATVPGTVPAQVGYWQEKQVPGGVHPANSLATEQPVYMIQAPAGAYHPHQHQHQHQHQHPQFVRPMAGPPGQGYYAVQRMPQQEPYRDHQPVYNVMPSVPQAVPTVPATLPSQGGPKVAGYSEGYGMVRPATTMGVGVADAGGYTQMAYDGVGRQMYYPPQGGVMAPPPPQQPQYQAMPPQAVVSSDMRTQEAAKVVPVKTTQASV